MTSIYRVSKTNLKYQQVSLPTVSSSVELLSYIQAAGVSSLILLRMSWSGGDWLCGACQHQNFKKRDACQRCGYPKFGGPDVSTYYRTEVMPGDWYCSTMNCGAHNFASRTTCHICGTMNGGFIGNVMVAEGAGGPPGWKPGDWMCTRYGCGRHNYASRTECFQCKTPRDYGSAM